MTILDAQQTEVLPTDEAANLSQRERELVGIVSAYNDVTDRLKIAHERLGKEVGRLHEELRRKNEELRRRERLAALGEMAAGLAHEIRNPLGGIALYASMLERELTGQVSAQTASKIFQGVRSLEKLVCEILDFAQEQRLECRACRLEDILADLHCRTAHAVERSAARIHIEQEPNLGPLWCDPERLGRVLLNVVLNAIESTPKARVRVSVSREDQGCRIDVTDNGPGIAAGMLAKIFNPFVTTKATGTGLGLAISHRIMEAHGGSLRACNQPEGGARFSLWLPNEQDVKSATVESVMK